MKVENGNVITWHNKKLRKMFLLGKYFTTFAFIMLANVIILSFRGLLLFYAFVQAELERITR